MAFADNYYDVKQIAELTGYTPQNITYLVRSGKLPFIKRGRKFFFEKVVLKQLINTEANIVVK